jgi:hypothetical protein
MLFSEEIMKLSEKVREVYPYTDEVHVSVVYFAPYWSVSINEPKNNSSNKLVADLKIVHDSLIATEATLQECFVKLNKVLTLLRGEEEALSEEYSRSGDLSQSKASASLMPASLLINGEKYIKA